MTRSSLPGRRGGFTLIEFTIVIALLGVMMLVAAPSFFSSNRGQPGEREQMSLWLQLVAEYTSLRGEVVLLEVLPKEGRVRAVRPQKTSEMVAEDTSFGEAVNLVEIDNTYVPAVFELSEAVVFQDIEDADGAKYTTETFYVVMYPYGWIDPVTFHLRDDDGAWTGVVNGLTGQIHWRSGYYERQHDEGEY